MLHGKPEEVTWSTWSTNTQARQEEGTCTCSQLVHSCTLCMAEIVQLGDKVRVRVSVYPQSSGDAHGNTSDQVRSEKIAEAQNFQDVKDLLNHLVLRYRVLQ